MKHATKVLLLLAVPFFKLSRKQKQQTQNTVSNPEIVKQRLIELDAEKKENLLTFLSS